MGVCVSVLASGSRGNSAVVSSASTRILVDAASPAARLFKRLRAAGDDPHSLAAIVITHEHSDHVYGLAVLAKKLKVPVFMTGSTHQAWARALRDENGELPVLERLEVFTPATAFVLATLKSRPSPFPTMPPIPWVLPSAPKASKPALPPILAMFRPACAITCAAAMYCSSNPITMSKCCALAYPWSVKQRVMSRVGHLSNEALAEFFLTDYMAEQRTWFWHIFPSRIIIRNWRGPPRRKLSALVKNCCRTACSWP